VPYLLHRGSIQACGWKNWNGSHQVHNDPHRWEEAMKSEFHRLARCAWWHRNIYLCPNRTKMWEKPTSHHNQLQSPLQLGHQPQRTCSLCSPNSRIHQYPHTYGSHSLDGYSSKILYARKKAVRMNTSELFAKNNHAWGDKTG